MGTKRTSNPAATRNKLNVGLTEQGKFVDRPGGKVKRVLRDLTPTEYNFFEKTGALNNVRALANVPEEEDVLAKNVCGPSGFTRHLVGDNLLAAPERIEGFLADGTLQVLQILCCWSPKTTMKVAQRGYYLKHGPEWGKGLTSGERKTARTNVEDVFKYIEDHNDDAIGELSDFCRLPSVSAQGTAIRETADYVVARLKALRFETQVIDKPGTGGQPVIYAEARGTSPKTLLFYNHYDVQPPEPLELWTSPPFEPVVRDGKLYGRGVCDDKGNLSARLAALKAWREVRDEFPCSLKFCIEGDEEIGSPHMEEFIEAHRELLAADACVWEGSGVTWEGRPMVPLGVKGLLYVELACNTISHDAHSSYGTVLPNAAWRIVWALSTIKGADERVMIEGFYDDVRKPTPDERAAIEAMPAEEVETLKTYGINEAVTGVRGLEYRLRHYLDPTATIDGLCSGYQGEGAKTVLPAKAVAKMDFRLVPNQDPHDIMWKLRRHLDKHGFSDITIREFGAEHPARTPISEPFVQVMREAVKEAFGSEPLIVPTMAGTGPLYPFIETLGLPVADCGIGYPDARIHAPDENIRIEDFLRGTKAIAALVARFGQPS